MDASEVIEHHVKRDGSSMILGLLRKSVSQSSKTPHPHSHRQILPLDKTRADVLRVRLTDDRNFVARHTLRRTVPALAFGVLLVYFDELGVVNSLTKSVEHGGQISLQAVGGELHAIRETGSEVGYEGFCGFSIPLPESPAWNEFGISVNRGPSPDISGDLAVGDFFSHLFLLAITEGPAFIYLNPLAGEVAQCGILIPGTGRP